MTEREGAAPERMDILVDRATRIVRLLTWTAMFALVCLMLWVVSGMAAQAGDPRDAARAIGNAGAAAAGAIARDSSNAANVPGYAGTDVPERNIGAGSLEDAARARLADPDDPGGAAGRAVIEGVTARPERPVAATDPAVARGKGIAADPEAPVHGADGLASGSATDCGAELEDAEDGGGCGQVTYCVGAGCETVRPQANTGFVEATTRLNMAIELGGEEFDREDMRFFTGKRQRCHIHFGGLANCCKNSGLLVGLRQLLGLGEGACGRAQRRQHPLSRQILLKAHLLRHLHPPLTGVVRVRVQAWAHPPAAGPLPARDRLVELPGPYRGRDRGHRFREPGSLRVHREPDGRLDGAQRVAARRRRHRRGHAHPHPRVLRAGPVMARSPEIRHGGGIGLVGGGRPSFPARNRWRVARMVSRIRSGTSTGLGSGTWLAFLLRQTG